MFLFRRIQRRSVSALAAVPCSAKLNSGWTQVEAATAAALAVLVASTSIPSANSELSHGIASASVARYNANNPSEDRTVVAPGVVTSGGNEPGGKLEGVSVASVLDGHAGWQVAAFMESRMAATLRAALAEVDRSDNAAVEAAAQSAFESLDEAYASTVRAAWAAGFKGVARVGACCIALALRPDGLLVCANAGDCRAVLGQAAPSIEPAAAAAPSTSQQEEAKEKEELDRPVTGSVSSPLLGGAPPVRQYKAVNLSRDHNAREPYEQARLAAAHPRERLDALVQCVRPGVCYVKGRLQPTRALGDLYLKQSAWATGEGRGGEVFSPPYITATPEVTIRQMHTVGPEGDCFVVLASDGLWDLMSSQEAVDLVARALHDKGQLNPDCSSDAKDTSTSSTATSGIARSGISWPWGKSGGSSLITKAKPESRATSLPNIGGSSGVVTEGSGPAQALLEEALRRAAAEWGLTVSELQQLPPGRARRQRHDDISVVVLVLK